MSRHRRRSLGFALAALVLVLAGLDQLGSGPTAVRSRPRVAVVIARRPLAPGIRLSRADLTLVSMPETAAAAHQLGRLGDAIGHRLAVALSAGSPLMDAELEVPVQSDRLRLVAVRLDSVAGVPAGDISGLRTDVLLTTAGPHPQSRIVLSGVRVVAATSADQQAAATLLVPAADVRGLVTAEAAGSLRLVIAGGAG